MIQSSKGPHGEDEMVVNLETMQRIRGRKEGKGEVILLGFLDPDLTEQTTHSPTMTRTTRQLITAIAAMLGMKLEKGDVTAAFLQGTAIERDLFVVPVEELAEALGIEPGQAARLTKETYGLVAAPL